MTKRIRKFSEVCHGYMLLVSISMISLSGFVGMSSIDPAFSTDLPYSNNEISVSLHATDHLSLNNELYHDRNFSTPSNGLFQRQDFQIFVNGGTALVEGESATFEVSIELPQGETALTAATFTVSVSGSGLESAVDFVPIQNFTITINTGQRTGTQSITVTPIDDNVKEDNEIITVTATTTSSGHTVTGAPIITILDDDPAPRGISLTSSQPTVAEDEGTQTVTITATVNGLVTYGRPQTIALTVTGSLAPTVVDFASIADFSIIISGGEQSGEASFTVTPVNDNVDEIDETLTVTTTNANVTNKSINILLTDDDFEPRGINLVRNNPSVQEHLGAQEVMVSLEVVQSPIKTTTYATDQNIPVTVTSTNQNGVVKFTSIRNFNLTLPAENLESPKISFIITPVNNLIDEENEVITLSSTSSLVTGPSTILVIDDDATPSIELSPDPSTVSESAGDTQVTVTATLSTNVVFPSDVTLPLLITDSGNPEAVDFGPIPTTNLVIAQGESSGSAAFILQPIDDSVDEIDETITIRSSNDLVSNAPTISLIDDDDPLGNISLSATPSRILEDDGSTNVTVTATLGSRSTFSESESFVIDVTGSGNTNVVEYTSVSNFTIVFSPGELTATESLVITPTDDEIATDNEQITLSSTDPLITGAALIELVDNDVDISDLDILLSSNPLIISESDGATTITITGTYDNSQSYSQDIVIPLTVSGSGLPNAVDFAPVPDFNLTMISEENSSSATFTLTPENDLIDEINEIVTISSDHPSASTPATLTISDDDEAGSVTLSANPTTIYEERGGQTITVIGRIDNGVAFSEDQTYPLAIQGTSGLTAVDFEPLSNVDLQFEAGDIETTTTFTIVPIDDEEFELDEVIEISSTDQSIEGSVTVKLINDDEKPTNLRLTVTPTTIKENAGPTDVTIIATIEGNTVFASSLDLSLTFKGDDDPSSVSYLPLPEVDLTIPPGSSQARVTIKLTPQNNTIYQQNGIVTIDATSELTSTPVQITLEDDDSKPTSVLLSVNPTSISESEGATSFEVIALLQGDITFSTDQTFSIIAQGSGVSSAVDYTPINDFQVTIVAQSLSGTTVIELTIEDDLIDEQDEVITFRSINPLISNEARLTLTDDDSKPTSVLLSVNPTSISESEGSTSFELFATLQGETLFSSDQTFSITAQGSGVSSAVDYTPIADFQLTIAAQSLSGSTVVELTIEDDLIDEQDEIITFQSTNSLITNEASLTLTDDDIAPAGVTLSLNQSTLLESSGSVEVTVTTNLTGDSRFASDKEFTLTIVGSGNPNAVKYSITAPPSMILPAGESLVRTSVEINPTDNLLDEINEVLNITVSDDVITATTQLLIVDDDEPPTGFVLDVSPNIIVEGAGQTQVTVTTSITGESRYPTAQSLEISISNPQNGFVGYQNVPSFTIDVPAGAQSASGSFAITPLINTIEEQDAIITITAVHLSAQVTATIVLQDDDVSTKRISDVNAGLLPDVTRAMISSSVGAVNNRFQPIRRSSSPDSELAQTLSHLAMRFQNNDVTNPWSQVSMASRLNQIELVASILENLNIWTLIDYRKLSGKGDANSVDYDGGLTSIHVGVDYPIKRFIVGLSISQFLADLDFQHFGGSRQLTGQSPVEGLYQLNTLTFNPYASWAWTPRSRVWTMLSLGSGNAEVTDPEALPEEANTRLGAFAAGVELHLLTTQTGIILTGEGALWGGLSSLDENISRIRKLDLGVFRFQMLVEAAYEMHLDNLGTLQPFIETGLRGDGGDGLTGAGIELGGGTRLDLGSFGLQAQIHGHVLLLHGADVNEWGFGGSLRYAPSGNTGPKFEINSLTGQQLGQLQQIWEDTRWYGQRSFTARGTRLRSQVGYGFRIGNATMTPFAGMNLGSAGISHLGAEYRLGSRLSVRLESMYHMSSHRHPPTMRATVSMQ
ncbi:MAG: hypothetical protein OXF08_12565 [Bacteroidetes bacterium]|nr:hypothetical protein [Bacteroidota bacterium]